MKFTLPGLSLSILMMTVPFALANENPVAGTSEIAQQMQTTQVGANPMPLTKPGAPSRTLRDFNQVTLVVIKGDGNPDGCIDIVDLFILQYDHYASQLGDSRYDDIYDMNNDSLIDLRDYVMFTDAFGSGCGA